jgi:hypothetical protein
LEGRSHGLHCTRDAAAGASMSSRGLAQLNKPPP